MLLLYYSIVDCIDCFRVIRGHSQPIKQKLQYSDPLPRVSDFNYRVSVKITMNVQWTAPDIVDGKKLVAEYDTLLDEGGCGFDNDRGGKGASGAGSVNHWRYNYYHNSDYSLLSCLGQTSIRLYTLL